ncbi:hypothetical protein C5167_006122 [Papaver somniferum]|uniref:Photosystem II PsbY n=1 Tax=Papaver somniferum TaxID=3469 RepID=A0A4Y7JFK6_PAPSO|nr:photosystem II core complex proteins psbY, chloroplastic-like [Papaver somniferum]RZC58822.1 hypothetical protein C5167_006122 [Papaver somniferum]
MAATISTMAMLNAKCLNINNSHNKINLSRKPISLLSLQNLPKGLTISNSSSSEDSSNFFSSTLTGTAIAGAIFSTLSTCDAAFAAQQIAKIAEGDNRGIALLLPIVPAILWVLYNILQPALNQLNKMRSSNNGVIVGLGLGALATASSCFQTPSASAIEIATLAQATAENDNRGSLLLFVLAPAVLWVLYNILQPALNQLNKMRQSD